VFCNINVLDRNATAGNIDAAIYLLVLSLVLISFVLLLSFLFFVDICFLLGLALLGINIILLVYITPFFAFLTPYPQALFVIPQP
jgi:hypothetical protein